MANPSISLWGATYSAVPGVTLPTSGGGEATFQWVEGSQTISENGTYDVTALEEVVVSVSGGGTPAISVVDTTDSHGGTIRTITALNISDSTLTTADQLAQGITAYNKLGVKLTGTGGGGATQHTIHLEFTDSTDTDIEVDYDDSLIGTMLTAYAPGTWMYSNKQVAEAQLDGVTWYEFTPVPIGVELIDYTATIKDTGIDSSGATEFAEWFYCSDYTPIEPSMTFSYRNAQWYYIGFYDESKNAVGTIYPHTDGTPDPDDNNTSYGTLTPAKIPSTAKYIRLCGTWYDSDHMSLIRTA